MKNFKYFAWFIWFGFGITFFLHNAKAEPTLVIALKSLVMTLMLYLFVNYVYASTMMKAIPKRNNAVLITKTLTMSVVETTAVVLVCKIIEELLLVGYVNIASFIKHVVAFSVQEWFGMFFITIILNFGFYGFNFFQVNMELQKKLANSQLQTLQSQINPHFMFNVLNYINVLINKDTELASDLLVKYSEILRFQLYSSKKEYNRLTDEIDFLEKFIDVERLRWADKLDVTTDWKYDTPSFRVSPLLLVVLVENAFKHVARSSTSKGSIRVNLRQADKQLMLEVENTATRLDDAKTKDSGIGVQNLQDRLQILYPDSHKLSFKREDGQYLAQLVLTEI